MKKYKFTTINDMILDIANIVVNGEKFGTPKVKNGTRGIVKAYRDHVLKNVKKSLK